MRFQYLKEHQNDWNIKKACKVLKVSRSGFYEYLHRKPSVRSLEDESLRQDVLRIFHEHKGRYGAYRISIILRREGKCFSKRRILNTMRDLGLVAKGCNYQHKHRVQISKGIERPNLLNQIFKATEKNKVWVGDITYIRTKKGFLYLAAFVDIYTRKVVGWSMDNRIKESIVLNAFEQAYGREHPSAGLIVHTDRGSQFAGSFQSLLRKHQFIASVSRKGNPYDNALMESFFRTLKRELINGTTFEDFEHAKLEVFKYIELYYNTKRLHSALGYESPARYESRSKL